MSKPYVLVDVDGVLADFLTPAVELANYMFEKNYHPTEIDQWDIARFMSLTSEQEREFYNEIKRPGFHARIHPYPGAIEGIKKLQTVADIHILTSPMHGETWCFERWHWLGHHFGIRARDVTHSHAKHSFVGDMLIDDKPANIYRWVAKQPGLGILWAQIYNQNETWSGERVRRTGSWDDVCAIAQELNRG